MGPEPSGPVHPERARASTVARRDLSTVLAVPDDELAALHDQADEARVG